METRDSALTKKRIIEHDDADNNSFQNNRSNLDQETTVNKGTNTFEERVVETEHVNDNDNPARQPDRRDQKGSPFDEGINEHNVKEEATKSTGITDMNRYASIDNAQTRTLNHDEKD